MPESLHIAKPRLAFAKLGATPTQTAWSQAYNAGNLFACISLSAQELDEDTSLQALGKEVLSALEAEFFTLEEKTLETISQAITTSLENLPPTVSSNVSVAFFKDDVLYLFISGAGKVLMKRDGTIGVLLEKTPDEETAKPVVTASGYVRNNDTIVLQTYEFAQDITPETLTSALELTLPNDIVELLSPQVHKKDDGGQAAIVVVYHGANRQEPEEALAEQSTEEPFEPEEEPEESLFSSEKHTNKKPAFSFMPPAFLNSLKKRPSFGHPQLHLPHRKKLFLSIAIVILILLGTSIYFTKSKQDAESRHELFLSVYEPAQKSYDEGKGLQSLNKSLSKEDFEKAKTIVNENLEKFPNGSSEKEQLLALLAKIESELEGSAPTTDLKKAEKAPADASSFLTTVKEQKDGLAFGQNETTIYLLTKKSISTITNGSPKEIIKNDDAWADGKAVIPYQGNLYVLDTKAGVLKYVSGGGGYGKRSYFTGTAPDLSTATSMAIDGSVWILLENGTILKYTSGAADKFEVSGLDTPMTKATQISTTRGSDTVFVLDQGTSRIVQLKKSGDVETEYAYDILADAQAIDVQEGENKIFVLSQNEIWEIPLE